MSMSRFSGTTRHLKKTLANNPSPDLYLRQPKNVNMPMTSLQLRGVFAKRQPEQAALAKFTGPARYRGTKRTMALNGRSSWVAPRAETLLVPNG